MSYIHAERCLEIIELFADGATTLPLGEIAEQLKLPKSGAHRMLATLAELGWAEQDADTGFYRLTMRLAILGQHFYVATGIPDIFSPCWTFWPPDPANSRGWLLWTGEP